MIPITEILTILSPELSQVNLRILSEICKGVFRLTGSVTGLNISRYTDKSGSYRNIQRFFASQIDWEHLRILLFSKFLFQKEDTYILAADECVEAKSGKSSFGLAYFFSSLASKVIPSICFAHLSILSVEKKDSYSFSIRQILRKKQVKNTKIKIKKRGKGRPKGSKNNQNTINYTQNLSLLEEMLLKLQELSTVFLHDIKFKYFVGDGAYGNKNYSLMLAKFDLKLISKLHYNAALYFAYTGDYLGWGRPRKYGKKLDVANLDSKFLVDKIDDKKKKYIEYVYKMVLLSKNFKDKLNILVIVRENRKTKKKGHVILFSNDLELSFEKIIAYYSLRFQIEFNFRDAKQFFGLSDFKNIKQTQLKNAVNLSLFMSLLSKVLLQNYRLFFQNEHLSINDLKSIFRTDMYRKLILNNSPNKDLSDFNSELNLVDILNHGIINGKIA